LFNGKVEMGFREIESRRLMVKITAAFGRKNDLIPPALQRLPNEFFTVPMTIHVCRIKESASMIKRGHNSAQ
jgi:hypothetical protein